MSSPNDGRRGNRGAVNRAATVSPISADEPTVTLCAEALADHPGATPTANQSRPGDRERLPRYFGKYELLEELGHGGMGVVYKAKQLTPERLVALKVIRAGELADEEAVRRFRQEADEAARLDHPNIVPVYEVGEHDSLHFFTMKLIEGGSLSQRLEQYRNDPKAAARLTAAAARAVHYAHQRQVLHRDLKPSNFLLDAAGQPHVADFGLAKRMEGGDACVTRSNVIVGTPGYMAPEQAGGEKRLTTAADVYALGGVLYTLLTGGPPFRGPASLIIQKVLTEEPAPPSKECPNAPRDLETICLKCLQKEPGRRYSSADELAEDLERYLRDEPIWARASAAWEKALKWAKRRPARAALSAGLFAVSLCLVVVVAWHVARMQQVNNSLLEEKTKAEAAAAGEKENAKKAEAFAALLVDLLSGYEAASFKTYGFHGTTQRIVGLAGRQMLDRAAQRVRNDLKNQPAFQATLLDTLGNVFRSLGDNDKAKGLLEEGLALRRAHLGGNHLDTAMSLFHLGWLHHDLGDYDQAEKLYDSALAIQKRLRGDDDPLVADTLFNLAWLKGRQYPDPYPLPDRSAEAERLFREVLRIRQVQPIPDLHDVAVASLALAAVLFGRGENLEALSFLADASRILEREGGEAGSTGNLFAAFLRAEQLRKNHHYDEAEKLHRQVLGWVRLQLGERHPITAMVIGNLAGLLRQKGELAEAEKLIREALDIGRQSPLRWHPMMADAMIQLADYVQKREAGKESERLYREAIAVLQHHLPDNRPMYDQALGKLKSLLLKQDRADEAAKLVNEAE